MTLRACVIGAGPNGLAAAIVLAQAGWRVEVLEAEPQPGGAARTLELTLPGFRHDFGSAVHPLAAGSPFFSLLPLAKYGLEWIQSPVAVAHPLEDGTAVTLRRDLSATAGSLGRDGKAWRRLMEPLTDRWGDLSAEVLAPVHIVSRHPWLLARFGLSALPSANALSHFLFREERTQALFAGLAAHSFLSLEEPLSAAFGVLLGAAGHAVGWPIPRGGAQSITNSLCDHLSNLGGTIRTSARVENLRDIAGYDVTLCDVTPRQLMRMADDQLSAKYKRQLEGFRYGCGVFKVDYALSSSIPWKARECLEAATVHVGGTAAEITASEAEVRSGKEAEHPFVLLAQPSRFDGTRAPEGKHTAWAYCHVPNGSKVDMVEKLELQIERFAPGFRDCVLSRRIFSTAALEEMDANLVGGDIGGGAMDIGQFLFRPTWRHYRTSIRNVYMCSSSTPPGGGVHGMCGYHAAREALCRTKGWRR
jgi:phytoene dehydrogenase-like protein